MDPSSSANLEDFKTLFLELDLSVDFKKETLSGSVVLTLQSLSKSKKEKIVLDGRGLFISKATCLDTEKELQFQVQSISADLGESITVSLTDTEQELLHKNQKIQIKIFYSTSPNASGLQWLPPQQTEGKQHPYMFSQFQAIHCRSAIPCQDSPGAKCPFKAHLEVDSELIALMSAPLMGKTIKDTRTVYQFEQKLPTPSYLIAFVVGDLASKEIGPRSSVWTERSLLDKSAFEFSETEQFLKTAESFLTPYEWGKYDLLILPSSFPYGGMENPTLTFVTPTLLAGDKSLALVVAHEIAHSWTGNLVTNVTWEHFWLNEGLTVFSERKILEKLQGKAQRDLHYLIGQRDLTDSIKELEARDLSKYTCLVHKLESNDDPDDAFSSVPYERGSQFLFYLERNVGAEAFGKFLQEWIQEHKFKNVNSEMFRNFFSQRFADFSQKVDWQAWFYGTGQPPVDIKPHLDLSLSNAAFHLAEQWIKQAGKDAKASDIEGWTPKLLEFFLGYLNENATLSLENTIRLGEVYGLPSRTNSEIRNLWCHLIIKAEYESQFQTVVDFITSQGRMKFVRPLYRALFQSRTGKQLARDTFQKHKSFYHPIAQKMVAIDLQLK